jgi:hypothetical protein
MKHIRSIRNTIAHCILNVNQLSKFGVGNSAYSTRSKAVEAYSIDSFVVKQALGVYREPNQNNKRVNRSRSTAPPLLGNKNTNGGGTR